MNRSLLLVLVSGALSCGSPVEPRPQHNLACPLTPPASGSYKREQPVHKRFRGYSLNIDNARHVESGYHIDLVVLVQDPNTKEWMAMTLLQNVTVLAVHEFTRGGMRKTLLLNVLPEEVEI